MFGAKLTSWGVPTGPTNNLLVLDVDVKGNGYETLKQYAVPDTMWQRTPSGGMHLLFKYPADGKRYGNRASKREDRFLGAGIDSRGDGGYIIWYGAESKPMENAPAWFTAAYQSVRDTAPEGATNTIKIAPEIAGRMVQDALERLRNAADGERNHTLNIEAFKIGQLVTSQSITYEYAFEALLRAAETCGLPKHEAVATIRSGLMGGHKHPIADPFKGAAPIASAAIPPPDPRGRVWTPARTTREELFDYDKLRKPQLFESWSTEDIHITTADGGTGKTTLKLFEAVCLALGERFLGFNCLSPGARTLFVTGEDTDKKLKAMLGQILKQMGLTENAAYNDKIETVLNSIYIKKDPDLCLIFKEQRSNFLMSNPVALVQVMQAVDEIRPKMIVFDPISSFWGSEAALNDMAKAVSKFMAELVERSGACVEMINHMGKQASSQKDMTQFAGRGGTGLPSHSRVSRTLRQVGDDEYADLTSETLTEKQSAMLCNVNKFSDGSPLYNKPFLILRDGFLFTRKHMTDAKAREAEQKLTDVERIFQFIKESRESDRFPSRAVCVAFFKTCGNPIPKTRVEAALDLCEFHGHLGEWIKKIENPDAVAGGKVYVIADSQGRES